MAVYDEQKTDPEAEQLRNITGIGPDDESAMERNAYNGAADDMAQNSDTSGDAHKSSGAVPASNLAKKESNPSPAGRQKSFTNEDDGASLGDRAKRLLKGKRGRNILIGTGVAGIGIGGVIGLLSVLSGPFELVHLSQILQKPLSSSNAMSENRLNKLFRYTRLRNTGDIGETRVGKLGSLTFKDTINKLSDAGIEFDRNPRTGNPKAMTIDKSKNPDLKGLSDSEAIDTIAEKFDVPRDTVASLGGNKFTINTRDMGIKATRALTKNSLTYLENGKVITGIRFRILAKFFNIPSLFHPMEKAQAAAENKFATAAERRATEKERMQEKTKPTVEKAETARAKIKGKLSGVSKTINQLFLLAAGMCLVRDVADAVVAVNTYNIVMPAEIQSTDKMAVGEQLENGTDFNLKQPEAAAESLVDENGKTVWQGKAMNYLANGDASGQDLTADYKQGFSNDTTAARIKKYLGGGFVGAMVCSKVGLVVQGLITGLIAISGFLDAGASWGLLAAKYGASAVATAGAMAFIQHQAANLLSSKAIVPDVLSGPMGGNLLAYGARAAANTGARASGGIPLTDSQEAYFDQQQQQQDNAQFRSETFFARMFDMNDYRSASSRFADSLNPSLMQNAANLTGKLMNFGSLFSQAFGSILPKAHAADTYDWGFPKVGIPENILDDTATEDPYANAADIAKMLDKGSAGSYVDKAKTCFGVDIVKTDGEWDVVTESEPVNPNSDDYASADCGNTSDPNWKRFMLFVLDTRTMKAAACYSGEADACEQDQDLAAGSGGGGGTVGSGPVGDAQDIAKKVLANTNVSYQYDARQDVELAAKGENGTCNKPIDPRPLQLVLDIAQQHTVAVSAFESHCSGHMANSYHYDGKAVDLANIDGQVAYLKIGGVWPEISTGARKGALFLQHQCPGTGPIPSGMTWQSGDVCTHEHI